MSSNNTPRSITRNGQVYEEDLIFERSKPGRVAFSLPEDDTDLPLPMESSLVRNADELRLPEVSEPDIVRHYTRLSSWNYGIDMNLYPLGSCTMKYNPRINEEIASLPAIADVHPDTPPQFSQNIIKIYHDMQDLLCRLTDMDGATLQPAAGAHGELTGLYLIQAAVKAKNEKRDVILIPDSAHGTNPATCTLAGFKVRQVKSKEDGLLDIDDIKANMGPDVAGMMITNPSTLGIFEYNIRKIADLLHDNGSYLYMDGANYNAIIGIVSLKKMGVDVSHLNLHKTFSTPHGGGGPGAAAVVVADSLKPYLPGPIAAKDESGNYVWTNPENSIGRMKSGPGHTGVVARALAYVLTYGKNIHLVAENSVLNANLARKSLADEFTIASPERSMHEAVFSDGGQKKSGFATLDLAKSLIDYGYHPPTVYFPLNVSGAMMVEPTETESPESIRHFAEVMNHISRRMKDGDASVHEAPQRAYIKRVDEVRAARQPILNYFSNSKKNDTGS